MSNTLFLPNIRGPLNESASVFPFAACRTGRRLDSAVSPNRSRRVPNRGYSRFTESETGRRSRRWLPEDCGSTEFRGACRVLVNEFAGLTEAAEFPAARNRLQMIPVAELMRPWIAGNARRFGERSTNTHPARYAGATPRNAHARARARAFAAVDLKALRTRLVAENRLSREKIDLHRRAIRLVPDGLGRSR